MDLASGPRPSRARSRCPRRRRQDRERHHHLAWRRHGHHRPPRQRRRSRRAAGRDPPDPRGAIHDPAAALPTGRLARRDELHRRRRHDAAHDQADFADEFDARVDPATGATTSNATGRAGPTTRSNITPATAPRMPVSRTAHW
ncbi:hypothetical protein AB5I41_01270 [Sphingomonas sp. MMS24-JH45]